MFVRLVNRIKQAFEIIGPGFVQSDSFTITLLLIRHNFIPSTFFYLQNFNLMSSCHVM
jgi:hypothetical protein